MAERVKHWGQDWYEEDDSMDYDVPIQLALFGAISYR